MTFQKGHKDFIPKSTRQSSEYRKKLSEKAKTRGNSGNGFKKGHSGMKGKKNPIWKGEDVGYVGLHIWVRKWKGKPNKCESCGSEGKSKYQWANIDHKYRRVLEDYMSMCPSCHKNYDIKLSKSLRPLREIIRGIQTIMNNTTLLTNEEYNGLPFSLQDAIKKHVNVEEKSLSINLY